MKNENICERKERDTKLHAVIRRVREKERHLIGEKRDSERW